MTLARDAAPRRPLADAARRLPLLRRQLLRLVPARPARQLHRRRPAALGDRRRACWSRRRCSAASLFRIVHGRAHRPPRAAPHRAHRHRAHLRAAAARLAGRRFAAGAAGGGAAARRPGRQLRGRAAARVALVSAAASGPGDGHRRRRQLRHRAGVAVPAAARRRRYGWHTAIGLAMRADGARRRWSSCCARATARSSRRRSVRATTSRVLRQLDTLWFCLFYAHHLRRLRRARELPRHLLPRPVRRRPGRGRRPDRALRLRRQLHAAGRRRARRPLRRHRACCAACYAARRRCCCSASRRCRRSWLATPLFVVALALLGAGNGAVFQLVPLRFARDIGVVTGLVGAAGGLGGFFLPSLLGLLKDLTGTYCQRLLRARRPVPLGHEPARRGERRLAPDLGRRSSLPRAASEAGADAATSSLWRGGAPSPPEWGLGAGARPRL